MKKINLDYFLILILFVCVCLKPRWTSQSIYFSGLIVWNTGYSNFITVLDSQSCLHLDPGGTLNFPKQIYKVCREKLNLISLLHDDRFHTRYQKDLKKLNTKLVIPDRVQKKYRHYVFKDFATFGHLDRRGFYLYFGDSNMDPEINLKTKDRTLGATQKLLLPNHGQPQHFRPEIIQSLRTYKMLITGSQSRSYEHHKKTANRFDSHNVPVVYKNIWGHLIFKNN